MVRGLRNGIVARLVRLVPAVLLLPSGAGAADWPNVVFINIDDLRCDVGCYGHPLVRTPNLDRLAARGMLFEQAHVQATFCNPSRSSFLTGLRPDRTGVLDNRTPLSEALPGVVTLPRLFRDHGYFTCRFGKIFHGTARFDDPAAWDRVVYPKGTEAGRRGEGRNLTGGAIGWCRWLAAEGGDEDQADGVIARLAVEFLDRPPARPFFLAVGFHKPHDPFVAPRRYFDLYPPERIRPHLHRDPAGSSPLPADHISSAWWKEFKKWDDRERLEFLRAYYACTTFVDAQLGRVLDALERQDFADETVVMLLSDHGYHLGERDWWNKNTLLEYSTRAPLIAFAPGMQAAGRRCARLVEFVDVFPTLTDLCGLPTPAGLDGRSFAPLLDDPAQAWKEAVFSQVHRQQGMGRAVRTEHWRYIEWDEGRRGRELYDHRDDPGEWHNLADDPDHSATVSRLGALLREAAPGR